MNDTSNHLVRKVTRDQEADVCATRPLHHVLYFTTRSRTSVRHCRLGESTTKKRALQDVISGIRSERNSTSIIAVGVPIGTFCCRNAICAQDVEGGNGGSSGCSTCGWSASVVSSKACYQDHKVHQFPSRADIKQPKSLRHLRATCSSTHRIEQELWKRVHAVCVCIKPSRKLHSWCRSVNSFQVAALRPYTPQKPCRETDDHQDRVDTVYGQDRRRYLTVIGLFRFLINADYVGKHVFAVVRLNIGRSLIPF